MEATNKRILVVDDEEDVREFLKIFLESNGYEVVCSASSSEAIERASREDFFLMLTDIAMPDMDGYEVIDAVCKIKPRIQFAVMTGFGYNPKHTLVRICEDHPCPCLFKPFNRLKVLAAVEQCLANYNAQE